MRRPLPTRFLFPLALALLAVPALAQRKDWRDDPALVAAMREHSKSVGEALNLANKARIAMLAGRYEEATLLGDRAAIDLRGMGGNEYATPAYEVLAETALRQGHPAEALRQCDACTPRLVVQRFAMTKALALIGVGRTAEARAIVLGVVGTLDQPAWFRSTGSIKQFPFDISPSVAALTASAYLIRSAWFYSARDNIEVLEDAQQAAALAPNDAVVRLRLGRALGEVGKVDAARAEFARAQMLGGNALRKSVDREVSEMEFIQGAARKAAGATTPP